jgi:GTP-binding protein HflX
MIRHRIEKIRGELGRVRVHRRLLRDRRKAAGVPVVALVGYTNAGKTTLLNHLTGAEHTAADRLFVTLDPAARVVSRPSRAPFILTDTVGFIRKLPHQLVAAFKATLEELEEADVLLHVVDASHPGLDEQMEAVESLLGELELGDRPTIVALNKVDRLAADAALGALVDRFNGVAVSARTGEGMDALLDRIERALRPGVERVSLRIPYREGTALAQCYERGRVLSRSDEVDGIVLEVELPRRLLGPLKPYQLAD